MIQYCTDETVLSKMLFVINKSNTNQHNGLVRQVHPLVVAAENMGARQRTDLTAEQLRKIKNSSISLPNFGVKLKLELFTLDELLDTNRNVMWERSRNGTIGPRSNYRNQRNMFVVC